MKQDFNLYRKKLPIHADDEKPEPPCAEHRCLCGRLLARATPQGIEVKCTRCKRLAIIACEELTP